ncbi:hypothetical protein EVAR_65713_1 [Eumeta japonica]|uniref:RNase H type-1 domain-containing protein n=1 Tax=Eumeta variegata TaxID=151549 RepID=A0A4C2AAI4_EUMVA|nr:hypothetical protein EVAR_65713_1 [Eumeta japonica]
MLTGPTTYNPQPMQRGGTYWISLRRVGALVLVSPRGNRGNERADELARNAAQKKTTADYDRFPLSFAKKAIRAASLDEWQRDTPREALIQAGEFALLRMRPDKTQDLLHVLEECPIFLKERAETEVGIGVQILRENFPTS